MSSSMDKLAKNLYKVIDDKQNKKPKQYDTTAVVSRVTEDAMWVRFPGNDFDTPVANTTTAAPGDTVQVRVGNGRAVAIGNATSPSTDDATANQANDNAEDAKLQAERAKAAADAADEQAQKAFEAAGKAEQDAADAAQSASEAAQSASSAESDAANAALSASSAESDAANAATSASNAEADAIRASTSAASAASDAASAAASASDANREASSAKKSAENASEYAARALGNLSTVQSITETLNWITSHGTMTLTTDTALDPTHVYFVQDNNGDYTVGGTKYAIVTEPDVTDISTYYELSIDESLNNYVATHLAVDSEGLWIVPDSGGNKVLIATGQGSTYTSAGTYIVGKVNNVDTVLAQFTADGGQIGQTGETHLIMSSVAQRVVDKYGNALFEAMANSESSDYTITNTGRGDGVTKDFNFYNLVSETVSVQVDGVEQTEGVDYIRNTNVYSFFSPPATGAKITMTAKTADPIDIHYTLGTRNAIGGIGDYSVVEGALNIANGYASHAEGVDTKAIGQVSHAEGDSTLAGGSNSHAQNLGTIANAPAQTAIGKYNDNHYYNAFEIGNGKDTKRSNAFAVDWSGNVEMALDTTATSGTDKELYDAIVEHEWEDDVINNDNMIGSKELYTKILTDLGGGGGDHVELTQAEYDALTPEEQTNGTVYFIKNGDPTPSAFDDYFVNKTSPMYNLDTAATTGTDKEIYDALVALGWTDCIV